MRSALAYDAQNLYAGREVSDNTPWTNGARVAEEIYVSGDSVDLQLATDANADPKRNEAVLGDLRLSIGNFGGTKRPNGYSVEAAIPLSALGL